MMKKSLKVGVFVLCCVMVILCLTGCVFGNVNQTLTLGGEYALLLNNGSWYDEQGNLVLQLDEYRGCTIAGDQEIYRGGFFVDTDFTCYIEDDTVVPETTESTGNGLLVFNLNDGPHVYEWTDELSSDSETWHFEIGSKQNENILYWEGKILHQEVEGTDDNVPTLGI